MKLKSLFSIFLALMLVSGAALAETGWHTDWDKAATESKKSGKPILIDFTGSDWCGWCIKLKEEVFDTAEFKSWASDNVVLLEIDFPRNTKQSDQVKAKNRALAQKYGVQGFPTIMFTKADGTVLGQYGYDKGGPENWTKKAEKFLN